MLAATVCGIDVLELRDIPVPEPGPGEALVRVHACAVCGSDVRILHHGNPRVRYPQVVGHEIAGEVVSVGEGVSDVHVGDHVAIGADVPCGRCPACLSGHGNNCPHNYAIGYQFPGGMAEYILLNRLTTAYGPVRRMPKGLSWVAGALAEPLACCLNGLDVTPVRPGDTVVIVGAGPIGCFLTFLCRRAGARKIILAQRSRRRLDLAAKHVPADVFCCTSQEELSPVIARETGGAGADVVFIAAAALEAQEAAPEWVSIRGQINFFGGLPPGTRRATLDTNLVHYKECTVTGAHGSTPRQHAQALQLIADGVVPVADFISVQTPLGDIHEAFQQAEARQGFKVVVQMP